MLPWTTLYSLTEQAATLDLLSNGRLDFGVGKGYRDLEFHGFAIPKEEAQERYEESLSVILKSFTSDERFSHRGKYGSSTISSLSRPRCRNRTRRSGSLRAPMIRSAVARSGYSVMFRQFSGMPARRSVSNLEGRIARVGRVYNPMEVTVARGIFITRTQEEYDAAVKSRRDGVAKFVSNFG